MTGPEHYTEAERLLKNVNAALGDKPGYSDRVRTGVEVALATAQVHATLALAAATVDRDGVRVNVDGWSAVAS